MESILATATLPQNRKRPLLVSRVLESSKSNPKNRRGARLELCPHCDRRVGLKTLKRHKKLYLKSDGSWLREWKKDRDVPTDDDTSGNLLLSYYLL